MKLLSLKESDEKKLKQGLDQLKDLHQHLTNYYSLRHDLIERTDRRYTLNGLFEVEMDIIRRHHEDLTAKTEELLELKNKLDTSLNSIEELNSILEKNTDGVSTYSKILNLTEKSNIENLEHNFSIINEKYTELFEPNEEDSSKIDKIQSELNDISNKYDYFFNELNDKNQNTFDELESKIEMIEQHHNNLFLSDDPEISNKADKVNTQISKVQSFYDKIYGNSEKQIPSLQETLDNRLKNLNDVESRAKSVIGLSSEAGLAGGFVAKGKEAKLGQIVSLGIFIIVVLAIFGFNLYLFDKNDFLKMTWDSLAFKLLINAPLIWMATIANLNLNRFSKLEQEYSHKEALAKSYERYKTEIQELEKLGVSGSEALKLKLLEINLDAFKVNPAENSDKARSDYSIFSLLTKNKKDETKNAE